MPEDISKEKEIVKQHIADARKTIKFLETAENNTNKSENDWVNIVKTRIEHCESMIKFYKAEEKRFEHFK